MIRTWPFKKNIDNLIELYNEFTLLVVGHIVLAFINPIHHIDIRISLGWALILTAVMNIVINLIIVIVFSMLDVFSSGKKVYYEIANHREMTTRLYNDDFIKDNVSHYSVLKMREEFEAYNFCK